MSYSIKPYSYNKAKKLNVTITPSTNPKKKIDVFKNGIKIASIGAIGYGDYPTFLQDYNQDVAEKKRKQYKTRHKHNINNKKGNGFWANELLW